MPTKLNLKETIIKALPELISKDTSFRKAVLRLVRGKFANRRLTEDRFDKILAELQRDREEQSQKWTPMVDAQARKVAKTLGIELFSYAQQVKV